MCDSLGRHDCEDGSDEDPVRCQKKHEVGKRSCGPSQMACGGKCVYEKWWCDGEPDCPGGEDEEPSFCSKFQTLMFNLKFNY